MIKQYFFATYNIKNRFISHTSKGEFSVVFLKYDWDEIDPMPCRGNEPLANVDYPKWNQELNALRQKYAGQIVIRQGMEFGMQKEYFDRYEKLFAGYPFDFIILSCHRWIMKSSGPATFRREEASGNTTAGIMKKFLPAWKSTMTTAYWGIWI